jgi:hypothetical protein
MLLVDKSCSGILRHVQQATYHTSKRADGPGAMPRCSRIAPFVAYSHSRRADNYHWADTIRKIGAVGGHVHSECLAALWKRVWQEKSCRIHRWSGGRCACACCCHDEGECRECCWSFLGRKSARVALPQTVSPHSVRARYGQARASTLTATSTTW